MRLVKDINLHRLKKTPGSQAQIGSFLEVFLRAPKNKASTQALCFVCFTQATACAWSKLSISTSTLRLSLTTLRTCKSHCRTQTTIRSRHPLCDSRHPLCVLANHCAGVIPLAISPATTSNHPLPTDHFTNLPGIMRR